MFENILFFIFAALEYSKVDEFGDAEGEEESEGSARTAICSGAKRRPYGATACTYDICVNANVVKEYEDTIALRTGAISILLLCKEETGREREIG